MENITLYFFLNKSSFINMPFQTSLEIIPTTGTGGTMFLYQTNGYSIIHVDVDHM